MAAPAPTRDGAQAGIATGKRSASSSCTKKICSSNPVVRKRMQLVEKWQKSREKDEGSEEEVSISRLPSLSVGDTTSCAATGAVILVFVCDMISTQDYEQRKERLKQKKLDEWKEREMARLVVILLHGSVGSRTPVVRFLCSCTAVQTKAYRRLRVLYCAA